MLAYIKTHTQTDTHTDTCIFCAYLYSHVYTNTHAKICTRPRSFLETGFLPLCPLWLHAYQYLEQSLHFGLVPENQFWVSRGRFSWTGSTPALFQDAFRAERLTHVNQHTHEHIYTDMCTLCVYLMRTRTHEHTREHMRGYLHLYTKICTNIHIQICVHYVCVCTHTYTPTHSRIYAIHTQILNVYTHTYAPSHTQTYIYRHGYAIRIHILKRIHQHSHEYIQHSHWY